MDQRTDVLLQVLFQLVDSVPDAPRRVLFKGISDLSALFRDRARHERPEWRVLVTGESHADVVGARNDTAIPVLVVFYRDDVQERESLNAFRHFDEDAIAEALVRSVTEGGMLDEDDLYFGNDIERLRNLLQLVYPSVERLADFLLMGKARVGEALPLLGLFKDETLQYDLPFRRWQARIEDNHVAAVLRWREFLDKAQRKGDARRLLGKRLELIQRAESEPGLKQEVLSQVNFTEALHIFNPPKRLVGAIMEAGYRRDEAEDMLTRIKNGTDPSTITPPLPTALIQQLQGVRPQPDDEGDEPPTASEASRVAFCLEAVLRLAQEQAPLPPRLNIIRDDMDDDMAAELQLMPTGQWHINLPPGADQALSRPGTGASELAFRIVLPNQPDTALFRFSLENLTGRLEPYTECWPTADFWDRAARLDAQHVAVWQTLQARVDDVRAIVDPEFWNTESLNDDSLPEREPNNPIYVIFDLLYLAHRSQFDAFLDAWIAAATLPWRTDVAARPAEWRTIIEEFMQLGLAAEADADGAVAVLPFHPLRLIWHRAIFSRIEQWLTGATRAYAPLVFDPGVLADQFQVIDRPHVLIRNKQRLVEASSAPFFSLFVPEARHKRARAPLYRAQQKIEQFGRMWPFSLARLHLAFQPGDAADDIYRLLAQQAEAERDAAFRVHAVVDAGTALTAIELRLLTTGDATTDLLTQEHHESLLPRVEYAKGRLDAADDGDAVVAHVALLVDAFREETYGFEQTIGKINVYPHWTQLGELARAHDPAALARFKAVDLAAPSYHSGPVTDGRRHLVYVPLSGGNPEYLRLLWDSLTAWTSSGVFKQGVYYEQVHWDVGALQHLHQRADWVILFDRTLDRSLFEERLAPAGIKLIDFYPNLPGGYRLAVSSRRVDAVEWQLVQVLHQFFALSGLNLRTVANQMLSSLIGFASGLLLKTLGGGSLAQELLGLYATYRALIADGELVPGRDQLIPLDNYQHWFGRRTQRGRRADLLVVRKPTAKSVEMVAVESKWYKQAIGPGFVADEFAAGGQLRTTVESLRSLFDPQMPRLDRDYWQRTLQALLDDAPHHWAPFQHALASGQWQLDVDGIVYVHQYMENDAAVIAQRESALALLVQQYVAEQGATLYSLGPAFRRLRITSFPQLVDLLGDAASA